MQHDLLGEHSVHGRGAERSEPGGRPAGDPDLKKRADNTIAGSVTRDALADRYDFAGPVRQRNQIVGHRRAGIGALHHGEIAEIE